MSLPFVIKAGASARAQLLKDGFDAAQFSTLLGASGGPKWFVLSGLDRFLAGDFFKGQRLDLLGTSVGGWRMAAHACGDSVAAIERFRDFYHHLSHADDASPKAISDSSRAMVATLLGSQGAGDIIGNEQKRLHLITAGCKGLLKSERKGPQLLGLGLAAFGNLLHRKALGLFFGRAVFHNGEAPAWLGTADLPTEYLRLTEQNLPLALEATGAIPLVLEGVRLDGSRHGLHRDGGILDYHFDLPLEPKGLVLYPHFYPQAIPGWFDKGLKWRKAKAAHYDKVVMVAPSPELVASLPHGKISDRKDFERFSDQERIAYWQAVIDAGNRLSDAFAASLKNGQWRQALL
ncbi:patatin-like phospholipase family protein [Gallaecimonas kandeliae]|uniref:patatin-like phospholipase family protein n=1 Tax=Gallaecimonas kandeliae TaxID=3029055 RepID=UPI002648FC53|nr:patatin-like phospholipase family protein [Gallaecimonas kandeliae]WKE66913.1 patatin-like phospholipase family protein [Gallaecimonas kandeliae]